MAYNVAVDVGGTFTDVLVFDEESGELTEGKVLTTPEDPSRGVVSGIENPHGKVGVGESHPNLLFCGRESSGAGARRTYRFLADGRVTYQDDRALTYPYGVDGGKPGSASKKTLIRATGEKVSMPSKVRDVPVFEGDRLVFETAGAGGLGDPLERDPEAVAKDVLWKLVGEEAANGEYGVVLEDGVVNVFATEAEREKLRASRPDLLRFDRGDVPEREELGRRIADERREFNEWLSAELGGGNSR